MVVKSQAIVKSKKMKKFIYTLFIIGNLFILSSCNEDIVFDQYAHTPVAGWEKNDTLSFEVPPLWDSGYYQEQVGLRITGGYPFMGLTIIVQQTIYPNKVTKKGKIEKTDTIQCDLIDRNGVTKGQGISYYQYTFPVNIYHLNANDSVHVAIRHDMKREILPGISDIGFKIRKIK